MTISCAILAPNYMASYYTVMVVFLLIIALAFMTTKWLSKSRFSAANGKHMRIIERMYLSSDKLLLIVLVDETYYLMSQDKSGIRLLDKLENFTPIENTQETKFSDILERFKTGNKDK